ncbi:MAG: radical SAM family heme chaperone HemW [Clostridia bacterium]|nr:radical SAM family heme chaperone HemW [Clostridia bacterium]
MTNSLGLYIHIPFCERKCNYCDFYSAFYNKDTLSVYLSALKGEIKKWGGKTHRPIDTIYIGGGTPSLLGKKIVDLVECIKANFCVLENAEITVEANPSSSNDFLSWAKQAGANRLSIGVQSGSDDTLKILGRNHTANDAVATIKKARQLGFNNISVDLMIALPNSNLQTLKNDIDFMLTLDAEHISAYILKIEQNTAFYKKYDTLNLPDDDATAEQYLYMCKLLAENGYNHYEISNFAKGENSSRHNLKYWIGEDYLGIGPAAHSCLDGKRFYYPRDLQGFIKTAQVIDDGESGGKSEQLMLGLRLAQGVDLSQIYGEIPEDIKKKTNLLEKAGYIKANLPHISLTDSGMLISNSIITELLENENI